ncbi:rhomboid family intramembrane serine protease [Streptomyces sp. NPDC005481]|uniref:rhomboid family intramembrane serine protease n=1 Tax=Streptomyces sp. NPDC005481 TaxID=3154881 RepID=UPI0033BC7483
MTGKWSAVIGRSVRGQSAPVTYGLIGVCCLIFVIGPAAGLNPAYGTGDDLFAAQQAYFRRWGVIPAELLDGRPRALLTPATALFIHGSWLHLLGNMLFLYVFGAMAEERMGRAGFALFCLGCGYLALLGYAIANAESTQTLVGASGAISAVLGAFLYLFPGARVTSLFPFLFFLPLRFPAWVVLPFWAVLQWLAAGRDDQGPGVAYLAHLLGFTAGFLCAWVRFGRATRVKTPVTAPEGENQP